MPTPLRVLIVEDSEDDALLIVRELRRDYEITFERVDTPTTLGSALDRTNWDLVICDYSMPHFSGSDALALLRGKGSHAPFIFVSGTIGEDVAVAALKMGAQDYVMKGNLKRLLPAVRRELLETEQQRERKRLEQEVQQLKKFEAIGRLAGGIAHDFNNVIGAILGWAELGYQEAPEGSVFRDRFKKIHNHAKRSAGLTSQLLAFARRQLLQPLNLNLNELVRESSSLLETALGAHIQFTVSLAEDLRVVRADPSQMEQVLLNLCLNARDAMPNGGRIVIRTENVQAGVATLPVIKGPAAHVCLSVSDTGVGMDAATVDRIFEPFFTTKEVGKGTGLGLATVYGVVKQHAGFVNVRSIPGEGTTFYVYLPSVAAEAEKPNSPAINVPLAGNETILLAEDHDGLREVATEVLSTQGYRVVVAANGEEALRLFKAHIGAQEIQLVILDVIMPELNGPEAYAQMRALRPRLPVIFTTGHTSEAVSLNARLEAGAVFLQKPYTPQALGQTVRSLLDGADMEQQS